MNRRRFLATSGISLAGAALWGCVTEDRPVLAPGVGKSATKSIVPTAKGAVRSKAVTLVSHDAQDLALHWSGNTLPTKGIRMEQPGLTWPAAAPIGGTVVGVTGLQASHGDLLAYWGTRQTCPPVWGLAGQCRRY
jgi:hypothetical protein